MPLSTCLPVPGPRAKWLAMRYIFSLTSFHLSIVNRTTRLNSHIRIQFLIAPSFLRVFGLLHRYSRCHPWCHACFSQEPPSHCTNRAHDRLTTILKDFSSDIILLLIIRFLIYLPSCCHYLLLRRSIEHLIDTLGLRHALVHTRPHLLAVVLRCHEYVFIVCLSVNAILPRL